MTEQEQTLERGILQSIEEEAGTMLKILANLRVKDPSVSESIARRMVWRLVDRGQLSFTPKRTFDIRREQTKP